MNEGTDEFILANFENEDFQDINGFPNSTQMAVMPVVAYRDNVFRPIGTCFSITNFGLVLTARHVVDEALKITHDREFMEEGWAVGVLYASEPREQDDVPDLVGGILPVLTVGFNANLDIAVMQLSVPVRSDNNKQAIRLPCFALSVGLPNTGTNCFALGYRLMEWKQEDQDVLKMSVKQNYSVSRGVIEEVHLPMRDSAFLSFPCFHVSARYDHGMSGGPILDSTGSVIGVVCSSCQQLDNDKPISYGSLVGPSLAITLELVNEGVKMPATFLYDYSVNGYIIIKDASTDLKVERLEMSIAATFSGVLTIRNFIGAIDSRTI